MRDVRTLPVEVPTYETEVGPLSVDASMCLWDVVCLRYPRFPNLNIWRPGGKGAAYHPQLDVGRMRVPFELESRCYVSPAPPCEFGHEFGDACTVDRSYTPSSTTVVSHVVFHRVDVKNAPRQIPMVTS